MNIETMASYICKPSLQWRSYRIQKWRYSPWSKYITIIKFGNYPFMAVYAMAERKQPSLAIVTSRASICLSRGAGNTTGCNSKLGEDLGWNHAVAKFSLAAALPQECNYGFTRARTRLHNSMRWQGSLQGQRAAACSHRKTTWLTQLRRKRLTMRFEFHYTRLIGDAFPQWI